MWFRRKRNNKQDRIAIVGVGKSGTTALYFRIKNSLHKEYRAIFEPLTENDIKKYLNEEVTILTKILMDNGEGLINIVKERFNKKILIVRDPRDILVSALLYTNASLFIWNKSSHEIENCIDLLKRKENDPNSYSVLELFKYLGEWDNNSLIKSIEEQKAISLDLNRDNSFFVFKYEDMINNHLDSLSNYLGINITESTKIDDNFKRVIRTKSSGSWKNWFLKSDIDFFRPLFHDYIRKFGFDLNWELNEKQEILPQHSSEYFRMVINDTREANGLSRI